MRSVELFVAGIPQPQGSKRCFCFQGRAILKDDAKGLGPWRTKIKQAARPIVVTWKRSTPLAVELAFYMPATAERPNGYAPTSTDIDKLARAVLDGLTMDARGRGILVDDSQVCRLACVKLHSDEPGVLIRVSDV